MSITRTRDVVLVNHQHRIVNHHGAHWVTHKVIPYGPFTKRDAAAAFAETAARKSLRQRYTLGFYGDIRTVGDTVWVIENDSNKRTIVMVEHTQPARPATAWASIRSWFGDKPFRPGHRKAAA